MSDAHQDPAKAFETHANYVDAFSQLAGFTAQSRWDTGLADVRTAIDNFLGGEPERRRRWDGDLAQVERSLRSAWGTELLLLQQLEMVRQIPDLARVVSVWAVVQTYYTGYHAAQALIVANGRDRPQKHTKTQSEFVNYWSGRRGVLDPWTMTYNHDGHGATQSTIDDDVSNLSRPTTANSASLAGKALRTTWEALSEERCREASKTKLSRDRKAFLADQQQRSEQGLRPKSKPSWFSQTRRNLTTSERAGVEAGVGSVGLLHYLYRLRVKANYVDGDTFSEGPVREWDVVWFVTNLAYLAGAVSTVHEQRVRHKIGADSVRAMQRRWVAGPGACMPTSGPAAGYRL